MRKANIIIPLIFSIFLFLLLINCPDVPAPTSTPTPGGLTATPGGPTATPGGPTATPGGPTATPGGPTATPGGPTATPGGPTATPGGPTATPGGPTATPGGPTATPSGPTPTNIAYNLNATPLPGWSVSSTNSDWQWGAVTNVGPVGAICYGTNISGNYGDNRTFADNYVQLGPLNFSGFAAAAGFRLTFDAYFHMDYGYDYAQIQYSENGTTFNEVTATYVLDYPYIPNTTDINFQNTWSPNPGVDAPQWRSVRVNLGGLALNGKTTVYFRWVLHSDGYLEGFQFPGFYIDNINIGY